MISATRAGARSATPRPTLRHGSDWIVRIARRCSLTSLRTERPAGTYRATAVTRSPTAPATRADRTRSPDEAANRVSAPNTVATETTPSAIPARDPTEASTSDLVSTI